MSITKFQYITNNVKEELYRIIKKNTTYKQVVFFNFYLSLKVYDYSERRNYFALIPSFEPDDKLIKLVKELKNNKFINVVVNDGSDEKYNNIFDECKKYAKVINYDEN